MTTSIFSRKRISKFIIFSACLMFAAVFFTVAQANEVESNMDNPFGVLEFLNWNHDWNSYKYRDTKNLERAAKLMREAGVGWVRLDFLWQDIEPRCGEFDFGKYDCIVEILNKYKINILGILDYSADWASPSGQWNEPPQDNSLFVKYARRVAERYKDSVKYWEVWNEPDSATYWLQQDGLKSYCVLLKETYVVLKEAVPDCKVLNGGLSTGLSGVNRLYENGAKDYFDIMNVHYFQNPLNKSAIKAVAKFPGMVRKVMSRNGDGKKKIWITEIGAPGVMAWEKKAKNLWLGESPNERQQGEWLKEVYSELLKDVNVEKIFWAFFRDTKDHWGSGVDYFGIVRWDFSKKPAYKAYKQAYENWERNKLP